MAKTDKTDTAAAATPSPAEIQPLVPGELIQGESIFLSAEPTREQVLLAAALAAFPHHLARTPERPAIAALDSGEQFAAEWEVRHPPATDGDGK